MTLAWAYLIVAGLFEIGWPIGLKWAQAPGKLIIGVVVGTYSSIFIASPIVLWWTRARGGRESALRREITEKAATAVNPLAQR